MIPAYEEQVTEVLAISQPSKTYKWDPATQRIGGIADGLGAVVQAAYKILLTERYAFGTYTGDYGNELLALIGQDMEFAKADIQRIVKEALTADDRITDAINFVILESTAASLVVEFQIVTAEGVATLQTGVSL